MQMQRLDIDVECWFCQAHCRYTGLTELERQQLRELCPEYRLAEYQLNFPGHPLNVMPDGPPLEEAEIEDENMNFSVAVNSPAQDTETLPPYPEQDPPPPYVSPVLQQQ
ncbi:hypothetical protein VKT23_019904 [Stygiomarasmius scandens]|uniref:Uncharacterized protein n=1 Tax=Marasmiellus scandens TaxID=2682957 RepID=A0ABR1ILP2_9AGAR